MVAILFAATRISPGRLQMTTRLHGDPDVSIGRGDRETCDTIEFLGSGKPAVFRSKVTKTLTCAQTPDAGLGVRHIDQACFDRHLRRFGGDAGETCNRW